MNILIVYPEPVFPVNSGGRARAWHIANYLSQNNKVTLLSLYWGINKDKKTKINNNFLYIEEMNKSYFVNRNWIRFLKYSKLSKYFRYNKEYIFFPSCLKLLKSFNADLIICNHSFMFLNCWLGKKNKIPIILDQQNVESEINKNLKFWEMFALKRANFITSCSPVDMDKMIKLFPRTENKIELIENGVDIKKAKNTVINRKAVIDITFRNSTKYDIINT